MTLTLFTNGRAALSDKQRTKLQNHKIRLERELVDWTQNGYIQTYILQMGPALRLVPCTQNSPFEQNTGIPKGLGCELSEGI